MAKRQYPRKLRQKLEKIATERDAREGIDQDENPNEIPPDMQTLWRHFLPTGNHHSGVALMHTRIDEKNPEAHYHPVS